MTFVHGWCALLFSIILGIGASARADPEDVKAHLVRVSPWPLDDPPRCGTGLVIEGRNQEYWLLTAQHNLGSADDGGVVLYSRRRPEGVVIKFEDLYQRGEEYTSWTEDDIALVPLTDDAVGLVADERISVGVVPTHYLGGNFSGVVVGVSEVTTCGPPETWESRAVPLEEPRGTPPRITLPTVITGPGGSGSPVVTPITGHVVGVYVGSDTERDGSIIWLTQGSVAAILNALRNAEVPLVDVVKDTGASHTLGIRLLGSVGLALEQKEFVGDLGGGLWYQRVVTYFEGPWLGFDHWFLGADLISYRFGFDRRRYSVRDPTDHFTLEEVEGPYHAITSLVRLGLGSHYAGFFDLSLGIGVLAECPFTQTKCRKAATADHRTRERLGFTSDVRLRVRLRSWLGLSLAGRFELVPGRELHVRKILEAPDPEQRRPQVGFEVALDVPLVGSLRNGQVR